MAKKLGVAVLLICSIHALAQKDSTSISVSFQRAPATELIASIEQQTGYTFFYIKSWTDTVTISVEAANTSITPVLRKAFTGTGLDFFILDDRVILTPGIRIVSNVQGVTSDLSDLLFPKEVIRQNTSTVRPKIIQVGNPSPSSVGTASIRGYIKEKNSGEPLAGVLIHSAGSTSGASSDAFGFYSLTLPKGQHTIQLKLMGMTDISQLIKLSGDGSLDFAM